MASPTEHIPDRPTDNDALVSLVRKVAARDVTAFAHLWQQLAAETAEAVRAHMINPADVTAIIAATFVEMWWLAPLHDAPGTDVRAWVRAIAQARVTEHNRGSAGMAFVGPMWTSVTNAETIELEVSSLLTAGLIA